MERFELPASAPPGSRVRRKTGRPAETGVRIGHDYVTALYQHFAVHSGDQFMVRSCGHQSAVQIARVAWPQWGAANRRPLLNRQPAARPPPRPWPSRKYQKNDISLVRLSRAFFTLRAQKRKPRFARIPRITLLNLPSLANVRPSLTLSRITASHWPKDALSVIGPFIVMEAGLFGPE